MSDINKEVGLNIRKIREDKGLSQEKLDAFFSIEIGTLWRTISLKHEEFLALAGIEVWHWRIKEFWVVYGLKKKGEKYVTVPNGAS